MENSRGKGRQERRPGNRPGRPTKGGNPRYQDKRRKPKEDDSPVFDLDNEKWVGGKGEGKGRGEGKGKSAYAAPRQARESASADKGEGRGKKKFSSDEKSGKRSPGKFQKSKRTPTDAPPPGKRKSYDKPVKGKRPAAHKSAKEEGEMRLNQYIAHAGVCSRREADKLIPTGVFKVNGEVVTEMGFKVKPGDVVLMEGQRLDTEKKQYVILNKPKGYITTTDDPQERNTVMDIVKNACSERIYPVGRLDRNTTGVLLLTNDGEMAKRLTHPSHRVKKVYHAELDKNLTKNDMQQIVEGIELEDGFIRPDAIAWVGDGENKKEIGVEIHSGRNRIVRRIFEKLGYEVVRLDRVMFAGITKKDTPRGKWRHLSNTEINILKRVK